MGNAIRLGNAVFWTLPTLLQFVHPKAKHPMVHLLTVPFVLGRALFTLPLLLQRRII